MKIVVDAMGGDKAPLEIVKGAVNAVEELGTDVILVGSGEEILRCIQALGMSNLPKGIEIAHTSEVITMEDDPTTVLREKKDSSMAVGLELLKNGTGDAMVSAGSTGALLSGATLIVKRIRGIRRAALAPVLPSDNGGCILIDCGANVECTVEYLTQFAFMGAAYAKKVLGRMNPRVALLNIGEESTKGDQLRHETYAVLSAAAEENKLNFIGNIEGRYILSGGADVIVCDGWSGNILIKGMEGVGLYILNEMKAMFMKNARTKLAASIVKNDVYALRGKLDYAEIGGSVLLGISKPVIKAHGASDASAVKNAIKQAMSAVSNGMVEEISANIDNMKVEK